MTKIQNNLIKLNNVRLSHPSLFRKKVWQNAAQGTEPRYEAIFILNKTIHSKEIEAINKGIDQLLDNHKISRSKIKSDHLCLKDGDLLDKEEYQDSFIIKTKNYKNFPIVNKDGITPVCEEDNLFYGGCYVSAYISLKHYNDKAIGISADLKSIQFRHAGEAFGGTPHDITGAYEPVDDAEEIDIF